MFHKIIGNALDTVSIETSKVRIEVTTEFGPRIKFFGVPGGKNILFWDNEGKYVRNDWKLRGGGRVWTTRPWANETEETYMTDNEKCLGIISRSGTKMEIFAPTHPVFKLRKGIEVSKITDNIFRVVSIVDNESDMLWSGGVWALACTDPKNKTYGIPLGHPWSRWNSFQITYSPYWANHTSLVNDPQISPNEKFMVIKPAGRELKRDIKAPMGLIGASDEQEQYTFWKYAPYISDGRYPQGANIAIYNGPNNFMTEMETMGPQRILGPGERIVHTEYWILLPGTTSFTKPEEISAVQDVIAVDINDKP